MKTNADEPITRELWDRTWGRILREREEMRRHVHGCPAPQPPPKPTETAREGAD